MKRLMLAASAALMLGLAPGAVLADHHEAGEGANPCAAAAENPCAAKENPCVATENPCAAKNPCNPCAAKKNPCGGEAPESER